jgi:hypothetical protein
MVIRRYSAEDEAFLRQVVIPEEDQHLYTTATPRADGFRWFRSPNVIPIEHWRRLKVQPMVSNSRAG